MTSLEMHIRPATINDLDAMRQLYHDTILAINSRDYNEEQISAWSSGVHQSERWLLKFAAQRFFVAEAGSVIAGFASLAPDGYLDFLYVHKDYQRQGVAKELLAAIEQLARDWGLYEVTSDVSITARPFFERQGFAIVAEQSVDVKGVKLTNFKAKKVI